jgi:hypothetical protein
LLLIFAYPKVWVLYGRLAAPPDIIYSGIIVDCQYRRVLQIAAEHGLVGGHELVEAMTKGKNPD